GLFLVAPAAPPTGGTPLHPQPLATLAHPSNPSSRNANHQPERGNVRRYYCPGTDERVFADRHSADDGRVGSDARSAPDQRGRVFALPGDVTAGVEHVGEDAGRSAEDIVFQRHAFVDRDVVLDLHVVADPGPGHDDDVLAEVAAFTDLRPGHDVDEVPD